MWASCCHLWHVCHSIPLSMKQTRPFVIQTKPLALCSRLKTWKTPFDMLGTFCANGTLVVQQGGRLTTAAKMPIEFWANKHTYWKEEKKKSLQPLNNTTTAWLVHQCVVQFVKETVSYSAKVGFFSFLLGPGEPFPSPQRPSCGLSSGKNTWAAGLYMQWMNLTVGSAFKLPSVAPCGREVIRPDAALRPRNGLRPSQETKTDCGISEAWHARHGGQTADNTVGNGVWVSLVPG